MLNGSLKDYKPRKQKRKRRNENKSQNVCTPKCIEIPKIPKHYNIHSIMLFVLLIFPPIMISSNGYQYGMHMIYTINVEDTIHQPLLLVDQMNVAIFIYLYFIITFSFISFLLIILNLWINNINFCKSLLYYQSFIMLVLSSFFILIQYSISTSAMYDFNLLPFGLIYLAVCADYYIIESKNLELKTFVLPKYTT